MKAVLDVIKREFQTIINRPIVLFSIIAAPLIMCFLLCEIFKAGIPRELPIAIYNADGSTLSRTITKMINATPSCKIDYNVTSFQEGRDLMVEGKIYAFLAIPKDFQRDIYRGTSPKLALYYNNQLISIGGVVAKDTATAVQTAIVGADLKKRLKKGASKDFAMSQVNLISVDEHVRSNPYLNYAYFLVVAILAQTFQALIAFLTIFSIGVEFKRGTTKQWMETSGNSLLTGVLGKLIPYFAMFLCMILITYTIYYSIYGGLLSGNIFIMFLTTLLFLFAQQMMAVFIVSLTVNLRLSLSIGAFYTVLAFSFAGVTFPVMSMPAIAQWYSNLLPLKHYLTIIIDQTLRGIPVRYNLDDFLWLIAFTIFGLIGFFLLKTHVPNEEKWGLL